jgi:glycine betaine/proline transport system substrate-binding protein
MKHFSTALLLLLFLAHPAMAEPASCKTPTLGEVDWTDLRVATATASILLNKLGYDASITRMPSLQDVYKGMDKDQVDVFMGYWIPAQRHVAAPYLQRGSIKTLTTNLDEGRYTLAVPDYVYDQGIRSFADLAQHGDKFDWRIYGSGKGSSGNISVQNMIDSNAYQLQSFKLIETSELLMLAQVKGRIRKGEWIAFLAWTPHPMNQNFSIRYLSGGEEYFGKDYGHATINTNVRDGLTARCPNLGRFFRNLTFEASEQEQIMDQVSNYFVPLDRAIYMWLNQHPEVITRWLQGVTHFDGLQADATAIAEQLAIGWGRIRD